MNFADNYVRGAVETAEGLHVHRIEMTEDMGFEAARAILSQSSQPALACAQDSLAFGVFKAARERGLTVGRDLTVFGGQNFPGSEHTAPPLSTFSTEDARVARLLSEVTLRHLAADGQAPPGGFEQHVIEPTPLLRRSHLFEA